MMDASSLDTGHDRFAGSAGPATGSLGSAPKRFLALGLDGADLDFIQARAQKLPTLNRLLTSGRLYEVASPKALSGSVWPTFYSAADPGVHGIYQHFVWDPKRMGMRLIGPDWCPYQPFWKKLEDQGQRVVVLDMPYSFPTGLTSGIEITDWGTHGQTRPLATNRPDIMKRVRRFGSSPIGRETPIEKSSGQLRSIQNILIQSTTRKRDLIKTLMAEQDWDLFVTVFGETHRAGHIFYSDADDPSAPLSNTDTPMLQVYQAVDDALGNILEDCGPETAVLVFSVHGMMRNPSQQHAMAPLMARLNESFMAAHCGIKAELPRSVGGVVGVVRNLVPTRLEYAIGAAAPDVLRQWVVGREVVAGLDWSKTPGFALRTDVRTELRLNIKGRETNGFLEAGSDLHRHYVDFITRVFTELRDGDTGEDLVDEVVDIPSLFPGPRTDYLPDLVVTWKSRPAAAHLFTPALGSIHTNPPVKRGGDHRDAGFGILISNAQDATGAQPPLEKVSHFGPFIEAQMAAMTRPA